MSGDRSQRTEAPTPKRRKQAREKGQVAKSPELVAWASLLASSVLLRTVVHNTADGITSLVAQFRAAATNPSPSMMTAALGDGLRLSVTCVLPLALGLMAMGTVVELAQVGLRPSFKRLRPDMKRVNPAKGLKRILSVRSVWETTKAALRIVVVALVAWPIVSATGHDLLASGAPLEQILSRTTAAVFTLVRNAALAGLALAAVDYGIQRRRVLQELRMTRQEVKEEHRQSEGNPQMRGAMRSLQMKVSGNRMIAAVRDADAVLVNPTHFAIALSYRVDRGAPEIVARGAGRVAARIRDEATCHGVPVVEDPPLTRMLYRCCRVGDLIPGELYEAVAHVLAFVFALGARRSYGGVHRASRAVTLPAEDPRRHPRRLISTA